MGWFNYYGLIFMAIIMTPNIIYAVKHKSEGSGYRNKAVELLEQIGRYGCFVLMIFNIPYTYLGFHFPHAMLAYLTVNAVLVFAYCLAWVLLWNKSGIAKALLLSVIPSIVFLFSGIVIASIPLIAFAVVFSVFHIFISLKNATRKNGGQ